MEIFTMLNDTRAVYADENGNVYTSTFGEERRVMRMEESSNQQV